MSGRDDRATLYDRLVDALTQMSRAGYVTVRGNDLAAILTPTGEQRIVDAAAAELRAARTKHPQANASPHHGHGVLLEEVEEAGDELELVEHAAADLWSAVRVDDPHGALLAVDAVEAAAVRAAVELVQVVATCRRYRDDVLGATPPLPADLRRSA